MEVYSTYECYRGITCLTIGKIDVADRGPAKSSLPRSPLQFHGGAVVNTSDYDRIGEGDSMSTRIKITLTRQIALMPSYVIEINLSSSYKLSLFYPIFYSLFLTSNLHIPS